MEKVTERHRRAESTLERIDVILTSFIKQPVRLRVENLFRSKSVPSEKTENEKTRNKQDAALFVSVFLFATTRIQSPFSPSRAEITPIFTFPTPLPTVYTRARTRIYTSSSLGSVDISRSAS